MNSARWLSLIFFLSAGAARAEDFDWSVYAGTAGSAYLSSVRTAGGAGGGVGVRGSRGLYVVQWDASLLTGMGGLVEARVAGGLQRDGEYAPAILATLSLMLGPQIKVIDEQHAKPWRAPAAYAGLQLEPLRFRSGAYLVSALQLGAGIGSDFPGVGYAFRLGLFEVGLRF